MNKKIKLFSSSLLLLQLSLVRAGQVWGKGSVPKVESQAQESPQVNVSPSVQENDPDFAVLSMWQDPDPTSNYNWFPNELPDPDTTAAEEEQYKFRGQTIRNLIGKEKNGTLIAIEQNGLVIKGATPVDQPCSLSPMRNLIKKAINSSDPKELANNIKEILNLPKENVESETYPDRLFFDRGGNRQIIIEGPLVHTENSFSYPDIRLSCLSERIDFALAWKNITFVINDGYGKIIRDDYVSIVPFAAIESNSTIKLYDQKTMDYGTEEEVIDGDTTKVYQPQKLLFNAIASKLAVVFNTLLEPVNAGIGKFQSGPGDLKIINVLSEINTMKTAAQIIQSKCERQENNNNNNSSKG